ncbi:MAG TPA: type II toxin-antitoxin system prevent-host-death family antitoxin [Anaeromyxobacteraceae bacterium]|nr:type II toxin-antitoxin system prevent-host-death family antitoxin [Anaeromyxobacteraceae bacterium]
MKTMSAAKFKTHCLRVMEEVRRRREPVVVTKKGVPVAKLVPADDSPPAGLGALEGRIQIVGDILSPATRPEDWEALR